MTSRSAIERTFGLGDVARAVIYGLVAVSAPFVVDQLLTDTFTISVVVLMVISLVYGVAARRWWCVATPVVVMVVWVVYAYTIATYPSADQGPPQLLLFYFAPFTVVAVLAVVLGQLAYRQARRFGR